MITLQVIGQTVRQAEVEKIQEKLHKKDLFDYEDPVNSIFRCSMKYIRILHVQSTDLSTHVQQNRLRRRPLVETFVTVGSITIVAW